MKTHRTIAVFYKTGNGKIGNDFDITILSNYNGFIRCKRKIQK